MRKFSLVFSILALALIPGFFSLQRYLQNKIIEMAHEQCPQCHFNLEEVNLWQGSVKFRNISFDIPSGSDEIKVQCQNLELKPNLQSLRSEVKEISDIIITGLKVTVISQHKEPEKNPDPKQLELIEASYGGKFLEGLPPIKIDKIHLEHNTFEHILKIYGKEAILKVSDINATISTLGTRKDLAPRLTDVFLTGLFQKSGQVKIKLKVDLFSIDNHDEIEVTVANQEMSDLDQFFFVEDGLSFKGKVDEIRTALKLHKGVVTGSLIANYHDLEITESATPDTGKFKAALITFFQRVITAKTKPDPKKPIPLAKVNYTRKPGENIIGFLLNGLKEAAFKVISN